jgi:hypothetical protein
MAKDYCLKIILFLMGILGVWIVLNRKTEGFTNITDGKFPKSLKNEFGIFPESLKTALLYPSYKMKNNPQISRINTEDSRKLYPTFAIGYFEQKTNNKKCWDTPCNGLTTPPDMCGGLYEKKQCKDELALPPPPVQNCRRVNYYCGISKNLQ